MSMFPKFLKVCFCKNHSQSIKLSGYYSTKSIVLKVFKSTDTFDETTFAATSDSKVANAGYMDVGNIVLSNVEMPPVAPVF